MNYNDRTSSAVITILEFSNTFLRVSLLLYVIFIPIFLKIFSKHFLGSGSGKDIKIYFRDSHSENLEYQPQPKLFLSCNITYQVFKLVILCYQLWCELRWGIYLWLWVCFSNTLNSKLLVQFPMTKTSRTLAYVLKVNFVGGNLWLSNNMESYILDFFVSNIAMWKHSVSHISWWVNFKRYQFYHFVSKQFSKYQWVQMNLHLRG